MPIGQEMKVELKIEVDEGEELVELEMVPVLIRSDIPELKGQVDRRILASEHLTWKEYLMMFGVELSSNDYFVRGSSGRRINIDSTIGEYAQGFKRNMKVHPVAVEKLKKREITSTNASCPTPISVRPPYTRKKRGRKKKKRNEMEVETPSPTAIPVRLPYTGKKRGRKKKEQNEMEAETPSPKRRRTGVISPRSISPPPADKLQSTSIVGAEISPNGSSIETKSVESVETLDVADKLYPSKSDFDKSAHITTVAIGTVGQTELTESSQELKINKMGPAPHNVYRNRSRGRGVELKTRMIVPEWPECIEPRYLIKFEPAGLLPQKVEIVLLNTKEDVVAVALNNSHSSDSSDLSQPIQRPNLKPKVMSFMAKKIFNKDLLMVQKELMKLRESGDYFKLTSVSPLAAGLLDQMLCCTAARQN